MKACICSPIPLRSAGGHRRALDASRPGGGGARFWHYATPALAITDALRLSRGMSYKNAMAGLALGGGKGVVLAAKQGDVITTAQLERSAARSSRSAVAM